MPDIPVLPKLFRFSDRCLSSSKIKILNNFKYIRIILNVFILVDKPHFSTFTYWHVPFVFFFIYAWQLAYTHLHIHSNNLVFFLHLLPTSTFIIYQSFTLFFNVDFMIMTAFITFCLFIMIVSATAFLDRQLAVSFETKYDNNHNEIKQLLTKNKQFDVTNWTHYALFIQLVVNIIVIIAFIIYTCRRCRQLFRLVHTSKQQPITSN